MPKCTFHPNVETSVRCVECDRPICPKDFVETPVGYKCKECARQLPSARLAIRPKQLALAVLAAAVVGIGGSFLASAVGYVDWPIAVLLGIGAGEAARRASGGHRGAAVATAAGSSVLIGAALAGLSSFAAVVGTVLAIVVVVNRLW